MKYIKNFSLFESGEPRKASDAMARLEEFMESKFVKDLLDGDDAHYGTPPKSVGEYEVDNEKSGAPGEISVWAQLFLGKEKMADVKKQLESDYEKFAGPFEKFAKDNDFFGAHIGDNGGSLFFNLTVFA